MKNFFENLINSILIGIVIIIIIFTVYLSLEVCNVINPPKQFSLEEFLYSKIDVVENGHNISEEEFENKVNNNSDEAQRNIVVVKDGVSTPNSDTSKLEELERLQAEKVNSQNSNDVIFQENVDARKFYYKQLDENGKLIYDKLEENIDALKTGTYEANFGKIFNDLLHEEGGADKLNNSFQLAINALTFDRPNLFYIDVTKMYLTTEITTIAFSKTYRVSIGGNGSNYLSNTFQTQESIHAAESQVENVKDFLVHEVAGKSREEQLRIVHDYLIDTINYDISAGENIYNIYGALVDKVAVCEGYSRAYKYILDELNIPCIIACGIAKNSQGVAEAHAWNYVYLDNNWYAIDVTWDDPIIIGSGKVTNKIKYNYYLRGSNKFFEDHFEDGNIVNDAGFKYPRLSVLDYFNK